MNECYKDTSRSASERADDLLQRLSLEEKIRQLSCQMLMLPMPNAAASINPTKGIGQIAVFSGKNTPNESANEIRSVQEKIIHSNRFGIPALFHCEALSGPCFPGALQFPTSISLGASFDPELVKNMADKIREQMYALGIRQALSPVLDIGRELRWGRVNETYGNDPTLVAELACAFISGLQSEDPSRGVAATAKHFLGYSATEGGINMAKTVLTQKDLLEVFAKPFEAAIQLCGLLSIMNSYSEIEGEPVCASKKILTDLLRNDLGFDGLTVSDYTSIERLLHNFHTSDTMVDAACQCLKAGLDMDLPHGNGYNEKLIDAVQTGLLDEHYIDRACKRVLELKFKLGLFEHPYPMSEEEIQNLFCLSNIENSTASLRACRETMTLTKNDGILPLSDRTLKIAVIGPTGNSLRKMYGCYTNPATLELIMHSAAAMAGVENPSGDPAKTDPSIAMSGRSEHPEKIEPLIRALYPDAKTIYESILLKYPNCTYWDGCDYMDPADTDFSAAAAIAEKADLVIVTVGGKNGWGPHCTSGEGLDTADFGLPGNQEQLLQTVGNANPNFIVIHTDSRPLVSAYAYEHARAVIEGWYCGTFAGQALAEVISGELNPSGHLQQDVPAASGALSYHYQQNASHFRTLQSLGTAGYTDLPSGILHRPFGYGLSYTTFQYQNLNLAHTNDEIPEITLTLEVTNTGARSGDDIVQIYGKDLTASMVRPYHELLGFQRIHLDPGDTKSIRFRFKIDQLAFIDSEDQWICEKGDYRFFAAKDSSDESLSVDYTLDHTFAIDHKKRCFYAYSEIL